MRERLAKLPSPAMAVAFVALLAALTGTAVALPGSNRVTSGDIKSGAVTTSDIRNSTVRGRDVRNNTLTGTDVNEGTLGTVPRAGAATVAGGAALANRANSAASVDKLTISNPVGRNVGDTFSATGGALIATKGPFSLRVTCDDDGGGGEHFSTVILVGPAGSLAQSGEGTLDPMGPAPNNFVVVAEASDESTGASRFQSNGFNVAAASGSSAIQARGYAGINVPGSTTECLAGGTLEG